MAATPLADFTPLEADLLLREHSWTPIVFTFEGLNLTGYTAPTFYWSDSIDDQAPATITGTLTPGTDTAIAIAITATEWTAIGALAAGVYELSATSPTGHELSLMSGRLSIEPSLLP